MTNEPGFSSPDFFPILFRIYLKPTPNDKTPWFLKGSSKTGEPVLKGISDTAGQGLSCC